MNYPLQPRRLSQRRTRRIWLIRAIAVLLIFEALGIIYLSLERLAEHDWRANLTEQGIIFNFDLLSANQTTALEIAGLFLPLAILAIIAAFGFLFLWHMGWVLAMMTQGLVLTACLIFYFRSTPSFIYPVMIYCIFLVLYLNSFFVRSAFDTPLPPPEQEPGHGV